VQHSVIAGTFFILKIKTSKSQEEPIKTKFYLRTPKRLLFLLILFCTNLFFSTIGTPGKLADELKLQAKITQFLRSTVLDIRNALGEFR
jgi:hypothetical protein